MRKLTVLIALMAMVFGTTASVAAAEPTEVDALLVDTLVFGMPADEVPLGPPEVNDPGTSWVSNGIWHVRGLPVADTVVDIDDNSEVLGSLTRFVNFNLDLTTFESQAWCSFTFDLDGLGEFSGHCGGSLISGGIYGNGEGGHLHGTYELAPGGVFGVGPYIVQMTIS